MLYCHKFPCVIHHQRAGYLRVTHPSAAPGLLRALDLHVLSPPLAFALSQDQTLQFNRLDSFVSMCELPSKLAARSNRRLFGLLRRRSAEGQSSILSLNVKDREVCAGPKAARTANRPATRGNSLRDRSSRPRCRRSRRPNPSICLAGSGKSGALDPRPAAAPIARTSRVLAPKPYR